MDIRVNCHHLRYHHPQLQHHQLLYHRLYLHINHPCIHHHIIINHHWVLIHHKLDIIMVNTLPYPTILVYHQALYHLLQIVDNIHQHHILHRHQVSNIHHHMILNMVAIHQIIIIRRMVHSLECGNPKVNTVRFCTF